MGRKKDLLRIVQETEMDHTNKWFMHNTESVQENETQKYIWDFDQQTDHLISARQPDLEIVNKKKKENLLNSAIPVDHRVKLKEDEKRDKYLDLARKLKNLWNMKVTVIPIVVGALGTIPKELVKGLEDL